MMRPYFDVTITIPNKAVEELSKKGIIDFNINDYKDDNNDYIFEKIEWNGLFYESANIYFNDGSNQEINDSYDIFGEEWSADYLSYDSHSLYEYVENFVGNNENNLRKLENTILTDNEIKNWLPGMTARIKNLRMERDE